VRFFYVRQRIFSMGRHTTKNLCRASLFFGARQTSPLLPSFTAVTNLFFLTICVRYEKMHGKDISMPCTRARRTAKYFLKIDFCISFYFSTTETLSCTLNFNSIHVSINLLFLTIMAHLKNFCRICQI
jgi:hypothetical protein